MEQVLSESNLVISIDAMGGDKSPTVVIEGLALAHKRNPDIRFLVYGDEPKVTAEMDKYPALKDVCQIFHTEEFVHNEDKPSHVIRNRETSMYKAVEAVKNGQAAAVVSAGNTGALMAISKLSLKTITKIHRPAIVSIMPHRYGKYVMLDLGANLENTAEELTQFGLLGSIYYNLAFNEAKPKVFLLNNGTEEEKGRNEHKEAHQLLKNDSRINFVGNIEGREVLSGNADVVVSDGFSGNIFLKTTEGTVKLVTSLLKDAIYSSTKTKIAGLLLKSKMSEFKEKLNYKNIGGAMLIGVNKIVIKAHGSSDEKAFLSAIKLANNLGNKKLVEKVKEKLKENN